MSMRMRMITTLGLLCLLVGIILMGEAAATTFIGSRIKHIDSTQQTITFQTREGKSWTLGVIDPNILTKDKIAEGDQVSIEVDLNDRIIKIVRLSE